MRGPLASIIAVRLRPAQEGLLAVQVEEDLELSRVAQGPAAVVADGRGADAHAVERVRARSGRAAPRGCRSDWKCRSGTAGSSRTSFLSAVSVRPSTGAEKTSCGRSPWLPHASAMSLGVEAPPVSENWLPPHCTCCRWKAGRVDSRPTHSTLPSSPEREAHVDAQLLALGHVLLEGDGVHGLLALAAARQLRQRPVLQHPRGRVRQARQVSHLQPQHLLERVERQRLAGR